MDPRVAAAIGAAEVQQAQHNRVGNWQDRWDVNWNDNRLLRPLPHAGSGPASTLVRHVPERLWGRAWLVPGLEHGQAVGLTRSDVRARPFDAPPKERRDTAVRWTQLVAREVLALPLHTYRGGWGDSETHRVTIIRPPLSYFGLSASATPEFGELYVAAVVDAVMRARQGLPPQVRSGSPPS